MQRDVQGANGSFNLFMGTHGSRVGDYFLNTNPHDHEGSSHVPVCVRMPLIGGGHSPKTHEAISGFYQDKPFPPAPARVRKPAILMTDDFSFGGEFSYLEISSDKDGFTVEARGVGMLPATSGPIRITDAQASGFLAALHRGVAKDQAPVAAYLKHQIQEDRGYIAEILRPGNWDETAKEAERAAGVAGYDPFHQIRETGLFLLKMGVPLPEATRDRWMDAFGALPETQAALSAARAKD